MVSLKSCGIFFSFVLVILIFIGGVVGFTVYLVQQINTTSTTTRTTATTTTTTSATTTTTTSATTTTTTSATTTTTTSATTTTTTSATTTTTTSATTTTTTSATTTTTTSATTTTTTSATTTSRTTTTATTSTTTTTAPCPSGYIRHPSGSCVNLLIDFNNCGSINYVCSLSFISCSNGTCSGAPPVILVGGVSVPGWGGSISVDDAFISIVSPFAISMYGVSTMNVSIQTNGCICLGLCTAAFTNGALPTSSLGGPTAFGYWDDLFITAGRSQTIYYGTTGIFPNRTLVFEYYTSHFSSLTTYYRFQIVFYENMPNIVRYLYYQSSDGGSSATIGTQASSTGPSATYSVDVMNSVPVGSSNTTTPQLTLTFNTNTNTYSTSVG